MPPSQCSEYFEPVHYCRPGGLPACGILDAVWAELAKTVPSLKVAELRILATEQPALVTCPACRDILRRRIESN